MKKLTIAKLWLTGLVAVLCFYACKKDLSSNSSINKSPGVNDLTATGSFSYTQNNLVADTDGFGAARIERALSNPWGIAAPPGGPLWISANHRGVSLIFDRTGHSLRAPVTIPSIAPGQTGAPSGVVFNGTSDFKGSKFIFASEDGIVAAWWPGNSSATKVVDNSGSNAVYKGIAMASTGGANYIYLTNFRLARIDVFDKNFNPVTTMPFVDPGIPAGFAPFNIVKIGLRLFVTYAKQKLPDKMDDQAGPGNGFVDVFNADGIFVKRFASHGWLNSPWGLALSPAGFANVQQTILIGNFGDGTINVFDSEGNFKGQLQQGGKPIAIDGLWAIDFLEGNINIGTASDPLFFTAGPDEESHGLFGTITKN